MVMFSEHCLPVKKKKRWTGKEMDDYGLLTPFLIVQLQ